MNSFNDSSGLNCSLSDLLESVDNEFEQPVRGGGSTVMTKDSIGSPQKSKLSVKRSKRVGTRKKSKDNDGSAQPLENSLSNLLESGSGDDDKHSGTHHHHPHHNHHHHHSSSSSKRRTVQESPTVETLDSVQKAKTSSTSSGTPKSRRGGKKTSTSTNTILESSLSDMLNNPDNSDDDSDDDKPRGHRVPRESGTVDSVQKAKSSSTSSGMPKSRRGGKKTSTSTSNNLESSLSEMLNNPDISDDDSDDDKPRGHRVPRESGTVDSVQKAKSGSTSSGMPKSRRGGKKTSTSTSTNLESSLSEMLNDPDNSDDDSDDDKPRGHRVPRESGTVDSMHRHTTSSVSNSGRSKRGGKRETQPNSLSLMGGPPPSTGLSLAGVLDKLGGKPKDFGRHADDNDTFCGLGTVGETEMRKEPLSKQSPRSDKKSGSKAKVTVAPVFGGTKKKTAAAPVPKAFMMSSNNDDDSDEEEDLFQDFGANPFRKPYH